MSLALRSKISLGTTEYLGHVTNKHIHRSMTGMAQTLSQILAAQKKTDYRPEEPEVPQPTQVSAVHTGTVPG